MSLVLGGVALADVIQNNVVVDGNDTISPGGSTTISYHIQSEGNDGQPGCNATVDSPATVNLSVPTVVTASTTSLVFNACNAGSGARQVTFSSNTLGSHQIRVISISGDGHYTNNANFTLHVVGATDTTPPVIIPTITGTLGTNGWYISNVTVSWDVVDNESAISSSSGCGTATITTDTSGDTFTCTATSAGGTSSESVTIKRDATAPSVLLIDGPADGESYYFGAVPAAPTCSASDATSGVNGLCSVAGYSGAVGTHTVSASATDNAGNVGSSDPHTYTVLPWTTSGFYSPVDMNNALNVVKAGSTVPLKFEIFAGTTEFTTIDKIASFKVGKVPCGVLDHTLTDDIELYSTGQTVLRYDATGGQFIQNWQVPKSSASAPAGTCYQTTLTTLDGSSITAYFKTK